MQIDSPRNPLIRSLLQLKQARGRREQGRFLAEGRRLIDGLLIAGWQAEHLLLREDLPLPEGWGGDPIMIGTAVAERLSTASTPSGYLACFPLPPAADLDPHRAALVLVDVADPGNAGTLMRSAAAFGIGQVLCVGGADPFGPKTLQATAGALATLRLGRLPATATPADLPHAAPWVGLTVTGGGPTPGPGPAWLLVGNEAHGLPPVWIGACDRLMSLPMAFGVESLNAAVAGSIAVFLLGGTG